VALKTSEGLAQMLASSLRSEFKRNWLTKIAALIAISVLNNFKKRFDHRLYNGAILLGLKGISVKSHGSADMLAFGNAISRAYDAAENRVLERIAGRIAEMASAPTLAVENI
jgi:glycerol-3-phosphate acyltransferase PlsX